MHDIRHKAWWDENPCSISMYQYIVHLQCCLGRPVSQTRSSKETIYLSFCWCTCFPWGVIVASRMFSSYLSILGKKSMQYKWQQYGYKHLCSTSGTQCLLHNMHHEESRTVAVSTVHPTLVSFNQKSTRKLCCVCLYCALWWFAFAPQCSSLHRSNSSWLILFPDIPIPDIPIAVNPFCI